MFSYTTGNGKFIIDGDKIIIKKRPLLKKFVTTKMANEITKVEYMIPDKSAKRDGFIRFFYDGCPSPMNDYPNGRSSSFADDILLVNIYYGAYEWEKRFKEALGELSKVTNCKIIQLKRPVNTESLKPKTNLKDNTSDEKTVKYKIYPIQHQNTLQEEEATYIRQIKETTNIMDKTTNPDTFFSRYIFLLETLNRLIELHKSVNIDSSNNQQVYLKVVNNKQTYIRNFINRYWKSTYEKIITLKTEKARENNRQKFIDSFDRI